MPSKGTADEDASLEDIIIKADGGLFNNAAQIWNHTFFWNSLSPNGGGEPTGAVADRINVRLRAATTSSARSSPRPAPPSSAPVGPGSSRTAASSRS